MITSAWKRWCEALKQGEPFAVSLVAVLVGLIAGLASVGFIALIAGFQWLAFGTASEFLASWVEGLPAWRIILVTTLGGFAVGWLTMRFLPSATPQSVAHVIEASALRGGRMSLKTGFISSVLAALSIGSGASVGREGPMVVLGAALGAFVRKRLNLNRDVGRTLLGCGVAAGIAASFNAPLAGSIFALEVVIGHYAIRAFAPTIVAAVSGTLVSRLILGDTPAFDMPVFGISSALEFPAFALLGLLSGALVLAFVAVQAWLARNINRVETRLKAPVWIKTGLVGFLLGWVALSVPGVLGVGYELTTQTLAAEFSAQFVLVLLVVKFFMTALCLAGGFSGGVFSPALLMGTLLGFVFGSLALQLSPVDGSAVNVYALVGMGATAAAMIGSPFSTILMSFELTGNYSVTMALMVAAVVACLLTRHFGTVSFFTAALSRRGINLTDGNDRAEATEMGIKPLMHKGYQALKAGDDLKTAQEKIAASKKGLAYVCDDEDRLLGHVDWRAIAQASNLKLFNPTAGQILHDTAFVDTRATLQDAVDVLATSDLQQLAVVDHLSTKRLVGILNDKDVARAHYDYLMRSRGLQ